MHNFAAYGAVLAGLTAAVIASDQLGAVGGPNGDAFMLALSRATEVRLPFEGSIEDSVIDPMRAGALVRLAGWTI